MFYAPHILFVNPYSEPAHDEDGNPVEMSVTDTWIKLGSCRCDDNDTSNKVSVNGQMYDYSYFLVSEIVNVKAGDEVKALDEEGNIRGIGKVIKVTVNNYLNYMKIWM